MKKIIIIVFILTTLCFILNTFPIFAQPKILINEFLVDPQPQSVEIFNSGTESADISDWIIDDSGGTTFFTIPKNNIIFPNQCLVYSANFNLNKTSADTVKLINDSQQLIDSFSYKSSSGSGVSYFRSPDGSNNWATGSANLGFYNVSREQKCLFPTMTLSPTLEPTLTSTITLISTTPDPAPPTPTPTPTLVQPTPTDSTDLTDLTDIYLSEAMVNPPIGEKEWIEIYNNNDFSVSLNDWYIDDIENSGSAPKIFSLEIGKKGYAVFDLSTSIFNNDGDNIRLLDHKKDLRDDLEYNKTDQGKTLGRTNFDSDDFCIQEPSKNFVNNPCIGSTLTPITPIPTATISKFQGLINQTPTKIVQTKIISNIKSTPSIKPVSINQLIDTKKSGQVLGSSNELITNSSSNRSLISLLTILSASYSLLTISSILFKMKLSYGKDKNFYSSILRSSRRK